MRKMTPEESKHFRESMKKLEGLEKLCGPIIKYIEENYGPHVSVVFDSERVRVIQEVASTPIKRIKEDNLNG